MGDLISVKREGILLEYGGSPFEWIGVRVRSRLIREVLGRDAGYTD
jgi:hypothetical protein